RYGGSFLGGWAATRFAQLGAHDTGNTEYSILPLLFADRVKESDVLVDVGCGRGRVIVWWLSRGCRNRMIGLELDPDVAQVCARRMREHKNVEIIAGNALDSIPKEGTLFYLFDPFAPKVVGQFKKKIEGMFCARDDIRIVFHSTQSLETFESDPNWRVEEVSVPVSPPFRSAVLTLIKPELCERCRP
ncbi:MAG: methyltransferase domain-containing protein, partial [Burkholderiales bacterium]